MEISIRKTNTFKVPVESNQLHVLQRRGKVKPVAKTVTAPPAKSASPVSTSSALSIFSADSTSSAIRDSKKVLEKPLNVEQKHVPCPNPKPEVPKGKPEQSKMKITTRISPRTLVSPRKMDSPKIIAFGRSLANPRMQPDFRQKVSSSERNDFRVTKSAYRPTVSTIFSYDLSPLERNDYGLCHKNPMNPMKSVPPTEVQLLKSGQRSSYLEKRYELTPDVKYNYPEATSMRYGWFHRLGDPFQKRLPRKD